MMLNQSDTEAKKCLLSSSQTKTGGLFVLKYISHRYKWIDLPETETVFSCSGTIETAPPENFCRHIFLCEQIFYHRFNRAGNFIAYKYFIFKRQCFYIVVYDGCCRIFFYTKSFVVRFFKIINANSF